MLEDYPVNYNCQESNEACPTKALRAHQFENNQTDKNTALTLFVNGFAAGAGLLLA